MSSTCENPERNCLNCELKSPLFCFLSDGELEMVRNNKITVSYRAGETIRKQGTYMSHVISVTSGLAKVYLEGSGERNSIIRIVKPTNFIGGPGIYLDRLHHYSVSALTQTTVCHIDVELFKELIDSNKTFAHECMKDFSRSILSVYNRLTLITQKQMPGRMAHALLYLADEVFCSMKFDIPLTRQDLADLSGMARDSAVKILREFQHSSIIRFSDNMMEITNPESLRRISVTG